MDSKHAIMVEDLVKTYPPDVHAVKGISFQVPPGQIFGFLGPNGAGKTTTVSMLTTLLRPTKGRAVVGGIDVAEEPRRVRRAIGLVFQDSTADGELTGRENMEVAAGLFGMSSAECRGRIDELLASMDLKEAAGRRVKGYSGGMKRRLELAVSLVHTPEVLFLDEPTIGLDPQGRAGFWRYISQMRKEQEVTVFMTTHYLDEVENLADRVSIIDHGKIIASGSNDALKERVGGDEIEVRVGKGTPVLTTALSAVPTVREVKREGDLYRVKCPRGEAVLSSLVKACDLPGASIEGIRVLRPSLDRVFLELTGKAYREEGYDEGRAAASSAFHRRRQGGG
ncbi:MAG: ATP-binding cassette domain-containing protein [Euryarchaeota archaeon]|nr:ATP-binding cassette domain-containing protein [Euryarchaeota archaeon]MDE1835024.1 ATP-binding cassette domain-containing protein [Euryarchaeota archaeon]MDE1881345.1 ATP-binding cassette domain-containing protein [Euryarchaeota archaeon]MDE2044863.1 ATP-binding cassette domain-containing protein [Thermoplasmata archaeon]